MKRTILWLLLCIFICLDAQINEMQVLLNQARMLESRNQFSQAMEIYESLYERFSTDENLNEAILRVSYVSGDFEKARLYLDRGKGKLTPYFLAKQEAVYQLKLNRVKEAEKIAFDWLDKNRGVMHHYTEFARLFESSALFDVAIEIYTRNREVSKDENLHALELSNAYYYIKNIDKCFEESLKYLRINPGYLYMYKNRINELVSDNPVNIRKLTALIAEREPDQVLELLAFAYVEVKDFTAASEIYEKLPIDKLIRFADDLKSDSYLDFALATYQKALNLSEVPIIIADLRIKIAQIFFETNNIEECIIILAEVIDDEEIQKPSFRNRTRANVESRLLMALINIQQNNDIIEIRRWFEEASNFAINQIEKSEILFRLARYLYLKEEYFEANKVIEQAVYRQDIYSNIFKSSYFYRYEIALFQKDEARDSLLTECIIHFSQDPRITDMLFLETFLNNINNDDIKTGFLQALKYKGLYQDSLAIATILEIADTSRIEELYILAYEWGFKSTTYDLVQTIEDYTFRNPLLNDFIFLQRMRNTEDIDTRRNMISNFLNNNPQNVFSPQLRSILFNIRS